MEKFNGTNNPKTIIVIPMASTPPDIFIKPLPKSVPIIVVDDSNGKLLLDKNRFDIYDYKRQRRILGEDYGFFQNFHKSSSCRNFGHYLAYKSDCEFVVALDNDCRVAQNFLPDHSAPFKEKNISGVISENGWINPLLSSDWYTRGFPYEFREPEFKFEFQQIKNPKVVLNMGLWDNVIDINGIDKVLAIPPKKIILKQDYLAALKNIPICGMNNMFLREAIPAYFFFSNFKVGNWTVSRHDDIWGGYIFKKIADKKGDYVTFGKPIIRHLRESSQPNVLHYEHYMHLLNRYFYDLVDESVEFVEKSDYKTMFADFTEQFGRLLLKKEKNIPKIYFKSFQYLHKSMIWWTNLFKKL